MRPLPSVSMSLKASSMFFTFFWILQRRRVSGAEFVGCEKGSGADGAATSAHMGAHHLPPSLPPLSTHPLATACSCHSFMAGVSGRRIVRPAAYGRIMEPTCRIPVIEARNEVNKTRLGYRNAQSMRNCRVRTLKRCLPRGCGTLPIDSTSAPRFHAPCC